MAPVRRVPRGDRRGQSPARRQPERPRRRVALARLRAVGGRPARLGRGRHPARRDVRVRRSRRLCLGRGASRRGARDRRSSRGRLRRDQDRGDGVRDRTLRAARRPRDAAYARGDGALAAAVGVAALAIGSLPWRIWLSVHDVPEQVTVHRLTSPSLLAAHIDRLPRAAAYMAWKLFDPRAWILLVPVSLAVLVVSRRARPAIVFVAVTAVGLALAGLLRRLLDDAAAVPLPPRDLGEACGHRTDLPAGGLAAAGRDVSDADATLPIRDGRPVHVRGPARRHRHRVRARRRDDDRDRRRPARARALPRRPARARAAGRRPGLHRRAARPRRAARRAPDRPADRSRPPAARRRRATSSPARSCSCRTSRRSGAAPTSTSPTASSSSTGSAHRDTWLPDELPDDLRYPVLVKARKGFGSRHIYRADDRAELEFFLALHDGGLDGAGGLRAARSSRSTSSATSTAAASPRSRER